MIGVHYSRAVRSSLSSAHYGSGNPCAARHRVAIEPRLRHRLHFYVARDGAAIVPERACGRHRHEADLSGLYIYDLAEDVLNLHLHARDMHPIDASQRTNALELSVIDAGFDGYLAPFGACDAVVLLGERTIDVQAT